MLHLLYILAFAALAFLAVGSLIRSVLTLGLESQRYAAPGWPSNRSSQPSAQGRSPVTPHPELLDTSGRVIDEPLLVMRSLDADEIRDRLDALYRSSPGPTTEPESGE